jgi:2-aminoadipate transaminase
MSQASSAAAKPSAPAFDFTSLFARDLPPPSAKWGGFSKYHFIGGNNDADMVPVDKLTAAATTVLQREGRNLATYNLLTGPHGYLPLRQFLVGKLKRDAGIACTPDDILITSGSLQGLDLVNGVLLEKGDTVLFEQDSYEGSINRLKRIGVTPIGIPVDRDGMRTDVVGNVLADLKQRGVRPKYIYTIPTVQNPTATIMTEARRLELLQLSETYGVPVFEDDCYADLVWDGKRPPAIYAMSTSGNVIYIGSFSKSIAPALRVGYLLANWSVMSRILPLKTDAGSGSLEQLLLAEFCPAHFHEHVDKLKKTLRGKCEALMEALAEQFGTAAEFDDPKGGIFLWVKLPDNVDTMKLRQAAQAAGVALNPGPEWSIDAVHAKSRLRLCFASPSVEAIRDGVAVLAEVCRREFGVPTRSANIDR